MRGHLALRCSRLSFALCLYLGGVAVASAAEEEPVLSIGGSLTEIVFGLDQAHRLVARDSTSTWPAEAEALPDVGYMRALSPEGVLSVDPGLIIAEEGSGPQETIDILEAADVRFVIIPETYSASGIVDKIIAVGEALEVPDIAASYAARIEAELAVAQAQAAASAKASSAPKRVLFVLSTRGGRVMAGGENTAAEGIIAMAGGVNAARDFQGYKLMSDEAITVAAPDVILMMARDGAHAGDDELFSIPAIASTPAGRDRNVIRIPGLLLLGFGPRTPQAISTLSGALYGDG
ncbi:MAG: ABC transporter substrate-binding protein [Pseudomonadota bacterium]